MKLRIHKRAAEVSRYSELLQEQGDSEAIARIVARRARAAAIGQLRPHDLRRALATRLLEPGVDVLHLRRILGHRSVTMTQIYDCRIDSASQAIEPATSAVTVQRRAVTY